MACGCCSVERASFSGTEIWAQSRAFELSGPALVLGREVMASSGRLDVRVPGGNAVGMKAVKKGYRLNHFRMLWNFHLCDSFLGKLSACIAKLARRHDWWHSARCGRLCVNKIERLFVHRVACHRDARTLVADDWLAAFAACWLDVPASNVWSTNRTAWWWAALFTRFFTRHRARS